MGTLSITGTQANQQPTTDEENIAPFVGVAISDTDFTQTETVTVTVSNPANGALSDLDGGTYDPETGAYTISGSAAAINAALGGLEFAPTPNLVAPGQTITTGFTITATDTAGGTATDGLTTVVATEVAATIGNSITLDGTFSEWPAADVVMTRKHRPRVSGLRRSAQRRNARPDVCDRHRRNRRDGPGHRRGKHHLFEYGSKRHVRI